MSADITAKLERDQLKLEKVALRALEQAQRLGAQTRRSPLCARGELQCVGAPADPREY